VTADILDARAIANEIYSHLGRKDLVQSLAGALPVVERLADEYAFSHAIPSVHSLVERTAMEAEIRDALRSRALVILKGMSGAGKSALAARVATAVQGEYDNVIWVDAREIDNLATLSNVDVTRSGFSHNVKTLLTHDQILLVLDDPRFALNDLEHLEKGTSKVIVTSQAGAGPDIVDVRDVEEAEAVAILTQDIVTPCPPDLAAMVRSSVGGHALVLRALNRLAKAHGWAAVQECIETDSIAGLEDETHKKVLRRVLRRQATELSEEIGFVHWCNAPRFHIELARLVSTLAIENLEKRGFLAATTPGYVRVHELVFKAIVAEHATTPAQEERLALRMADFIREESETDRSLGSGSPPVKSCGWI
jgi:energy-coupling factor transporter ATP-binding protein EcfA2